MNNLRFEAWVPGAARLTLIALLLLVGYGISLDVSEEDHPVRNDAVKKGDVALYRAIVKRMETGEGYYPAVGEEQHQRGYPTKPFLTWRLPTSAWIISQLGEPLAANLLRLLTVLAILAWIKELRDLGLCRIGVVTGALMLYSSLIVVMVLPTLYLHEAWAATLMALSLPLRRNWWYLSVFCGTAALAFRELALPFALIMTACALWERSWREAGWWVAGLVAFAIALTLHAWIVAGHLSPDARPGGGWLALGGWEFVLAANLWNLLTISSPGWFIALWMPLALIGAAARQDPLGQRLMLTTVGYSVAFLFVGRGDNHYWGIIYAPLVAVSLTFAPAGLRSLWHSARKGSG